MEDSSRTRGIRRVPGQTITPRLLPALSVLAAVVAGCASRVVVQDEPPRRPITTSSLPSAPPPQPAYGVRPPDRSYEWNQSPTRLKVGGPPPPAAAQAPAFAAAAPRVSPSPGQRTVVVAPGDTLYGISRRYHVSMAALMDSNRMRSPAVKPGDTLVLPR